MRLIWDIVDDYDEAYVIGVREGIARWWRRRREKKQVLPAGERVVDMHPLIASLDPDTSQFTTMMERLWEAQNKRLDGLNLVHNAMYWLEDDLMPRITSVGLWGDWRWIEA